MSRKNRVILDTETANGLEDPIMYDLGFAVIDKKGNVYVNEKKLDEPYVDDGKVYTMVFLKDNIIIFTYLSVESCYAEMEPAPVAGADRSEEPISNQFDRASLENYIIKNQDAIKVYVLEILLKS